MSFHTDSVARADRFASFQATYKKDTKISKPEPGSHRTDEEWGPEDWDYFRLARQPASDEFKWKRVVSELRVADEKFQEYSNKLKILAAQSNSLNFHTGEEDLMRLTAKRFMQRTKVLRSEYLMLWRNRDIVSKFYLKSQNNKNIVMETYMKAKKFRKSLYSKIDNDPYFMMTYNNLVKWEKYIYECLLDEKIQYYTILPSIIPNEIKKDVTTYMFDRSIF